jgi:hypothetical protein
MRKTGYDFSEIPGLNSIEGDLRGLANIGGELAYTAENAGPKPAIRGIEMFHLAIA